jgi:hypothetical protein
MKGRGFFLLIAGFLAGAYVAALDPEETNWRWFVPAVVIAAIGVQQIKQSTRTAAGDRERLSADREELEQSLERIVANLEQLRAGNGAIPPFEMRFEIDRLFRDDLMKFVDARETLARLYGIQAYADIVSEFAAGERYLNRVWSASADGYIDEVTTYIDKAHVQFDHAKRRLEAVQAH